MSAHNQPNKKRRLSPPRTETNDQYRGDAFSTDFSRNAALWNLEGAYEKRAKARKVAKKQKQKLPLKTDTGIVNQYEERHESKSDSSPQETPQEDTPITDPSDDERDTSQPQVSQQQQILDAKEELAKIADLMNENPEENIASLKTLAQITSSKIFTVTQLGLATQLSVYKDIIPGYRIRALSEEESKAKVSKDVRRQRDFEQSIVRGYHAYVKELKRIVSLKGASPGTQTMLADVAVGCACNLLKAVPHFNFRNELLSILVNKVTGKPTDANFTKCTATFVELFENDDEGSASLEAVSLLSKMIKTRNYRIHEDVLNLFLHLRLLSEFSQTASDTHISEPNTPSRNPKLSKKHREHRSKKERKILKERQSIEKEFKEADAIVSHEHRDKNQAETLKLVFSVYFRILKARVPGLMGAVLEGLVKYAHLVNQDFFGDLLEALRELVTDLHTPPSAPNPNIDGPDTRPDPRSSPSRDTLLSIITAFGLLSGQDVTKSAQALGLDLTFFIHTLYSLLHPLALDPDIESTSHSRLASTTPRVNVSTTIVLLLRSLRSVLLPSARNTPPVRLAAFAKQLMTCALHLPERSTAAVLGLLAEVTKAHKAKINALWYTEERRGDGVFDAKAGVEGCNPFAATVWEGELLRCHYARGVRRGVEVLEGGV